MRSGYGDWARLGLLKWFVVIIVWFLVIQTIRNPRFCALTAHAWLSHPQTLPIDTHTFPPCFQFINYSWVWKLYILVTIGDLKQARTATAVNKQLNFTVKNKPHTTNHIYCIFEAYFMIKSLWKNCIDCFEVNLK